MSIIFFLPPPFQPEVIYSLLFYAHQFKNNFVFMLLVEMGTDLLWRNNKGANILQLLAKEGNIKCAKLCVDKLKVTDPESVSHFIGNQNHRGKGQKTEIKKKRVPNNYPPLGLQVGLRYTQLPKIDKWISPSTSWERGRTSMPRWSPAGPRFTLLSKIMIANCSTSSSHGDPIGRPRRITGKTRPLELLYMCVCVSLSFG